MSDLIHYTADELDALDEVFGSDGWKIITRDAAQEAENLQVVALESTRNFDQVMYLRGQAAQIAALLNLPAVVYNYRADAEASSDADV